jgi:hypothetical protein
MIKFGSFNQTRRDKKNIGEEMSIEDILALGDVSRVVSLNWENERNRVSLDFPYGVFAKVICNRSAVVCLINKNEDQKDNELIVINEDGSKRLQLSNSPTISGRVEHGKFGWIERAKTADVNCFGVIFMGDRSNVVYQLDIDAETGKTVAEYRLEKS